MDILPRLGFFLALVLASSVCQGQMIIAHRGASHLAPENTIAAFELAWQLGADGIEGDFYLTRDKEIVCIHDGDTRRTTDADLDVEDSTLEQLRQLDAGSWKGPKWQGQKLPTLAEVFATVPAGGVFVIELKSKSNIVPVLAEQLRRLNVDRQKLLLISFDAKTIEACKERLPKIPAQWLTSFDKDDLDLPASYRPTPSEIVQTLQRCGADGVGLKGERAIVDAEFVAALRDGGCDTYHVWTIDSPDDAIFFSGLDAFAITTNRPAVIHAALEPAAGINSDGR